MLFNYVLEPNSNLLCCICRMPFVEPVTTRTCSHTFCRDCIVQAISHARQCPVDRSVLSVDDLLPANSIIRSLVDELVVECVHRTSGCTHTCQRQSLATHVIDACPFGRVACPKGECTQTLDRIDAESHICPHTLLPCDRCGAEVQSDDFQNHRLECNEASVACEFCSLELSGTDVLAHNHACPEAVVPCSQAANGCGWTGPRATLSSVHTPSCPYEAIKGFFALNTTKFERIAEENLILRHKVDTLEHQVQTTKRELQSAKTALGPWYRPDGVYAYSADLPPELQPASASSSSSSASSRRFSVSFAGDAPTQFDQSPPQDVLAAYFPSETPDPQQTYRDRDVAARRRTLPAGWEPPFGVSPGASAASHTVAPLNLSTTLEGALAGVRASVVALAGSVDSLGRRNDIALTNETLRLNEEVMSLRANVHGLRMQVHTIMMDRNAQVTGRSGEGATNMLGGLGDGAWPLHASAPRFYNYNPQAMSPGGQSITKL